MKQRWNDKMKRVMALLLVLSLCLGLLPISSPLEAEATEVKTSMHETTEIANGTFEAGRTGYSVKDWYLTAMNRGLSTAADYGLDEGTIQSYLRAFTMTTEEGTNENKVAALNKTGAGYVAMTSARFSVNSGETCWINYDYFLQDIQNRGDITYNREGAPYGVTDNDFHGIQMAVREYDAEGNSIAWTRLSSSGLYGDGKINSDSYTTDAATRVKYYTSANWMTVSKSFVPTSQTATVELYLKVGAESYVTGTVLFDNVKAENFDIFEVPNGDFSAVTHDAEGGREEGVMGPAGWTTSSCTSGGASITVDYTKSYVATIVDDTDTTGYNPVMKYQYKNLTATGYAFIQSPSIEVEAGEKFSASFRYKIEGQMAYTPKATIFFYNANGVELSRHHTNLNKGPVAWTVQTTSSVTVPEGAVTAKIGFFGSRRNDIQNMSGYPAEYTHTSGNRSYDTYTLYFDDVSINGKVAGWHAETSGVKGVPREDGADYTDNYGVRKVNGEVGHEHALQLYISRKAGTLGGVTFYSAPLDIVGGKEYTAAFDLKIENYNRSDINANYIFGAAYVLRYLDSEGNYLNADKPELVNDSPKDNMDWTRFTYTVIPPAQATKVQIGLVIGSNQKDICKDMSYSWDNLVLMQTEEYGDFLKDPAVVNSPLYERTALFVGDTTGSGMAEVAKSYSEMVVTNACSESQTVCEQLVAHAGDSYDYLIISTGQKELDASLPTGVVTADGVFDFDIHTYAGALEYAFAKIAEIYGELKVVYVLTVDNPAYKEIAEEVTKKWNIALVTLEDTTDKTVNWNESIESAETAELFSCYDVKDFDTYLTKVYEEIEANGTTVDTNLKILECLAARAKNCQDTHEDYSELQALASKIEELKKAFVDFEPKILGATIAVNDPNQLRFLATAPKRPLTSGVSVKKMGILVMSEEELKSGDMTLTIDNTFATQIEVAYVGASAEYDAVLSLEDVEPEIEYTARAYVIYEVNGTEYTYYSSNDYENRYGKIAEDGYCTKSVYGIAKKLALKLSTEKEKDMNFSAIGGVKNKKLIATATVETSISLFDVYRLLSQNVTVFETWFDERGLLNE